MQAARLACVSIARRHATIAKAAAMARRQAKRAAEDAAETRVEEAGGAAAAAEEEPATPTAARHGRAAPAKRPAPPREAAAPPPEPAGGASDVIEINRAPVLTLWAAAVAEREGHTWEAALTFGHAIAGRFAQSKGRSLGLYEAAEETPERAARKARERAGTQLVAVFGTKLLSRHQPGSDALYAAEGAGSVKPAAVVGYLQHAFGTHLERATAALRRLAAAVPAEELASRSVAYDLYRRIRPKVPAGVKGWGRKGAFNLADVAALAAELEAQKDAPSPAEKPPRAAKRAKAGA